MWISAFWLPSHCTVFDLTLALIVMVRLLPYLLSLLILLAGASLFSQQPLESGDSSPLSLPAEEELVDDEDGEKKCDDLSPDCDRVEAGRALFPQRRVVDLCPERDGADHEAPRSPRGPPLA